MYGEWIDPTLLMHALLGLVLATIIWRAARKKKRARSFWRSWPPGLLVLWAFSEALDAAIYGRRWLARLGVDQAAYEGRISLILNTASLIAMAALIYRIYRGDVDEEVEQ